MYKGLLTSLRHAYTIRSLAPVIDASDCNTILLSPEVARVGSMLQDWSDPNLDGDGEEPPLFEHLWMSCGPTKGAKHANPCNVAIPDRELVDESPESRRQRKGKMRAAEGVSEIHPSSPVPRLPDTLVNNIDPTGPSRAELKRLVLWEEEARRRRAWLRRTISADRSYGKTWTIIPRVSRIPIHV
jgi:hypothetical protein